MISNEINSKIESLLYISTKPLSCEKLAKVLGLEKDKVKSQMENLIEQYETEKRGIRIVSHKGSYKMATDPQNADFVRQYVRQEVTGELSKPSLETLAIVTYRGPITKEDLELIRGVNCSMILRNLMIRGLVRVEQAKETKPEKYDITFEFMRYLGISNRKFLPEYERWSRNEIIEQLLKNKGNQ